VIIEARCKLNYAYFCEKLKVLAKAVIVGASGLVGGSLLEILLQSPAYQEVAVLVRKELPLAHSKLKQVLVDFESLSQYESELNGHALFCCLGSTRKKTPDLAIYRKIDHDYPLQLAQIALKNGIQQYHLVSAMGANADSSNFYTKMKGETENDIKDVGLNCLHIYRPALLTGNRTEKRAGERFLFGLSKVIDPILIGGLRKYRSIAAATVANAMYKQSLIKQEGVFIHPSDEIKEIA
jgi:uncharacterized protein YbjT (DUF2867 family)